MKDDALDRLRRKSVPLWVWIVVVPPLLYLALWAATLVAGARHVRLIRVDFESGGSVPLNSFDPTAARPKLPPNDKNQYAFLGNFSCPCPLVTRYDMVVYQEQGGLAVQQTELWLGNRWKDLASRCYWSY